MQASSIARFLFPLAIAQNYCQGTELHQNFYGQTGLLTIPNAWVAEPGEARFQYSDYFFHRNDPRHAHSTVGNFGVFPNLEVGGRIAWFETQSNCFIDCGGPRDLSAQFKLQIPFIPDNWFQIAVGATDLGGQVSRFSSRYLVASQQFGALDLSVGLGQALENRSGSEYQYLNGIFAGGSWEIMPWLKLLGEYDSQDVQLGFTLSTPPAWFNEYLNIDFTSLVYSSQNDERQRQFFSLSLALQLTAGDTPIRKPAAQASQLSDDGSDVIEHEESEDIQRATRATTSGTRRIIAMPNPPFAAERMTARLADMGFERISVQIHEDQITVSLENNVFNRNEVDAIGVALGIMADSYKYRQIALRLILKNLNIPVLEINTDASDYTDFLNGTHPNPIEVSYYQGSTKLDEPTKQIEHSGNFWKPRLTFSPLLANGIASEYGVWDYSAGLQTNITVQLWRGAMITAAYNGSIDQSGDFEQSRIFYRDRIRSGWENAAFQQAFSPHPQVITQFQVGRVNYDFHGIENETAWQSPRGEHKFMLKVGRFRNEISSRLRDQRLLTYRYYWPSREVSFVTTAGKFWHGDTGFRNDLAFRFGDQYVSLFYINTDAEFVGMAWTFPLSPRKDFNSAYLQIKGRELWAYGLQTRINERVNLISFETGNRRSFYWGTNRSYANNDRLNPTYVEYNLERLKEAYHTYR